MTDLRQKRSRSFTRLARTLIALLVMSVVTPISKPQAQLQSLLGKLSPALQQALVSNKDLVWSNQTAKTVRVLVQTNGPVSVGLITTIALLGGSVVRQFTSIDGLLAEMPAEKLLSLAERSDVEHMSADHLAEQAASHLEAATIADGLRTKQFLGNGSITRQGFLRHFNSSSPGAMLKGTWQSVGLVKQTLRGGGTKPPLEIFAV